ncbi:MAG: WYL domain-containing protein [Lachnospiraceae bacterium]|nr:WYL domain-containing protein [Lachnospiraceae bacterium]
MKLFDETESKYYELISCLLLLKKNFTGEDIDRLYTEIFQGEKDYEILDTLFSKKEGNEAVFTFHDGKYSPVLDSDFPVRCNLIEQQAFGALADVKYADRFLSENTVAKNLRYKQTISTDWKMEDITIKNQFQVEGREDECGTAEIPDNSVSDADQKIKIIAEAIIQNRPILYDNIKDGAYEYRNESAYPVKIEYSFLNDSFRISAYHPYENRFFMMTLDTIRNVRLGDEERKDLQSEYKAFLNKNRKKVILDVEPSGHVIERCFRVFSYYERKAVYNRKDDFYRLEITYNSYDEAEIIRDILSLGSSVVVLEPLKLRKKIRDRIIDACRKYEK